MSRSSASGLPALAVGIAITVAGSWLTLVSVGGWLAGRMLPPGVAAAVARALLAVASELIVHAWPLALVALGLTLALAGALRLRAAVAGGGR